MQQFRKRAAGFPPRSFIAATILGDGPHDSFDVVVTLETFSHVADQPKLIEVIANLLRDRGYLILTTQNRSIYTRKQSHCTSRRRSVAALGDDAGIATAVVGVVRMPAFRCRGTNAVVISGC